MAIHYYHCTDGVDLVLDRAGRETRHLGELRPQAACVAGELMREVPDYADWDKWSVHVYDETGEIEIIPFTEALARSVAEPLGQTKDVGRARRASPRTVRRSSH